MEPSSPKVDRDWRQVEAPKAASPAEIKAVSESIRKVDDLAAGKGVGLKSDVDFSANLKVNEPSERAIGNQIKVVTPLNESTVKAEQVVAEGRQERNSMVRENLKTFDYYLEHASEIETSLDSLKRDLEESVKAVKTLGIATDKFSDAVKSEITSAINAKTQALREYESKFIPAEMRGKELLPAEDKRDDIEKAYADNLPEWLRIARMEQDKARSALAEKNMPESGKKVRALERQLEEEKKARELAENRAGMAERVKLEMEGQLARETARREEAEKNLQLLRDQVATEGMSEAAKEEIARLRDQAEAERYRADAAEAKLKMFDNSPTADDLAQMPEWIRNAYDYWSNTGPERLVDNSLRGRLGRFGENMMGLGTGIVTTEGAAIGATLLFPQLGPIAYLEGSLAATAAWLTAEVMSTRRRLETQHPRLAGFIRRATIGSVGTTLANTAVLAMENAGVTHFFNSADQAGQAAEVYKTQGPKWTADLAHTAAREGNAARPVLSAMKDYVVTSGQGLSSVAEHVYNLHGREAYPKILDLVNNNFDTLTAWAKLHGHLDTVRHLEWLKNAPAGTDVFSSEAWQNIVGSKWIGEGLNLKYR